MYPVVKLLNHDQRFICKVCVTGQHRNMLDQVNSVFGIKPEYDLDIMTKNQTLNEVTAKVLVNLKPILRSFNPDLVLVHGDTATSFAGALAAYYEQIPVGHVEAGLRTNNILSPWPEEGNRKLTAAITNFHFAPTCSAKKNLLSEGVSEDDIFVTGNTVVDALKKSLLLIKEDKELQNYVKNQLTFLNEDRNIILVTGHRRESFGQGFENICISLAKLAQKYKDIQIVYPMHLNPKVRDPVMRHLSGIQNISLIEPLNYLPFISLMSKAKIILTDSGGIQEEAPSIGKPVLVMRDRTERPEAVEAGTVKLVGTEIKTIFNSVSNLLNDENEYLRMSKSSNPFGDGFAAKKIVEVLAK